MANTYSAIYVHFMFSTKNRVKHISPKIEKRVWNYIAGIAKRMGIEPLMIGGTDDHVHLLLKLPPDLSISFVMQKLKSISSKWMNDTFYPQHRIFRWQAGYAAFGVSYRQVDKVKSYIQNQRLRHKAISTEEEFNLFLGKMNSNAKTEEPGKTKKATVA
jgi:putative transposase